MIERDASVQDRSRQPVKVPAERVRDRLRFEVIVKAREIAPAGVATKLDQPCAKHQPEERPSIHPVEQRRHRRRACTGKDREEPQFEQQGFPSEAVERLADIHKG